jgi:hypothetical protein
LFTAAHALLDNNVTDEAVIISTLAFAWNQDAWTVNPDDYGRFEFLAAVDGVSLLRLPDITTEAVTYEGSRVPKAVKINVYSRGVKSEKLAEIYERLLTDHKILFDECGAGSVAWDVEDAALTLTVRAMKELHSGMVSLFDDYPAGRIYSFPPPALVSGFYRTLLGSTDKRTFSGYAYILAEGGRHTPQKAVIGSVAWLLGESNDTTSPRERRPRIARTLNKHLLAPREETGDEQKLPEDYWRPDDTLWRDAARLGPRLTRSLYHLQESCQQ